MTRARLTTLTTRLRPHARALWSALALLVVLALFASPQAVRAQMVCALPGDDGPNSSISGIVNTYYPGVGTASGTTINVSTLVTGAAATLAPGDLILVMQMQEAALDTRNTGRYGDASAGDPGSGALVTGFDAGLYEYAVVVTFNGTTQITVRGAGAGGGLSNTYTTAAATTTQGQMTFQVIRVPQYSSATITGTVTAPAWNGATGGVVVIDVAGALAISGSVNVDAKGFRGGGGRGTDGPNPASSTPTFNDYLQLTSYNLNGQKGEGVAGTPRYVFDGTSTIDTLPPAGTDGYPGGSTARGAPGNAGGGGTDGSITNNEENSGGGGGGNAGAGGMGGMTWRSRRSIGGFGGVMSVTLSTSRVVMGGGGGAASRNNSATIASSGGAGGGIILIRANTLSGAGTLTADGGAAYNLTANDGGGGGGAGGSILVRVANAGSYTGTLAMTATGGRGGDAWASSPVGTICGSAPCDTDNRHGPGGGGGGGYVATTWNGAANVAGGANGITTTGGAPNNVYGATPGTIGTSTTLGGAVPGASSGAQCVPALTVTKTTSTPTVRNTPTGVAATYTITVANAATLAPATNVTLSDTLPTGFTYTSTGTITYTGSAARSSPTDPTAGAAVPAWSVFTIPGGGSVALTFTVNIANSVATGTYQNPATATYLDPRRTTTNGTTTASYVAASSTAEDVAVTGSPKIDLVKTVSPAAGPYTPGMDLTYTITFTNSGTVNASTVTILDIIPFSVVSAAIVRSTEFKVGSMTFTPGTSTLTLNAATGRKYYRDTINYPAPVPPWTPSVAYTPAGAAGTYDPLVSYVAWQLTGNMPPGTSGSVTFVVRIK